MNRDARGKPSRIVLKNQPRLRLTDVLRRRRSTLTTLVNELGVTTYAGLTAWCHRMGVVVPSEDEFTSAFPKAGLINSPQEGIVVLEAPVVIAESTGEPIDLETTSPVAHETVAAQPATEASQKKRRPKKEDPFVAANKLV